MSSVENLNVTSIYDSFALRIFLLTFVSVLIAIPITLNHFSDASRREKMRAISEIIGRSDTSVSVTAGTQTASNLTIVETARSIIGTDGVVAVTALPDNHPLQNNSNSKKVAAFLLPHTEAPKATLIVSWREDYRSLSESLFLLGSIVYLIALSVIIGIFGIYHRFRVIFPVVQRITSLHREALIARTAQMLAHDVRKPFSICRVVLSDLLQSATDQKLRLQLAEGLTEVNKATDEIENLISDVLEIGASGSKHFDAISPDAIIEKVIFDAFKYKSNDCNIQISYNFTHGHKIRGNAIRIRRVFANIVANAIDAMNGEGHLWISTTERTVKGNASIEFRIGNSGPQIPAEHLVPIFDSFYTNNKRDGTGLGLAIAKKIVLDHGGNISCRSSKVAGTEFIFDIPACPSDLNKPIPNFPSSSTEARNSGLKIFTGKARSELRSIIPEEYLHRHLSHGEITIEILVVDDEEFYLASIRHIADHFTKLNQIVNVHTASNAQDARLVVLDRKIDILITDFHLTGEYIDGMELVEQLRPYLHPRNFTCIHSNVDVAEMAQSKRIHGYVKKPLDPQLFAKILCAWHINGREVDRPIPETPRENIEVVVLDDSIFYLEAWKKSLNNIKVHLFLSPSNFLQAIADQKINPDKITCIISDYFFAPRETMTGLEFAESLLQAPRLSKIPVFISTDADLIVSGRTSLKKIAKTPLSWEQLLELL
jgi:signal transduction histidine kinase/DNA-binding response OmpR family regulator